MNETGEMLYHTVMSNCFYLGEKVDEVYQSIYNEAKDNFMEFLDFVSQKLESFTSAGFNTLKIADEKLDI